MSVQQDTITNTSISEEQKQEIINDFILANLSRETSLLGRKEVLTGKAKFGIFGDGKEVAQIAMSKFFEKGDFRSGYYRDQTFIMAIGELNVKQYFAGLYAHTDINKDPMSAGRQMGGHFSTHSLDEKGNWNNLMEIKNSSSDISPTAGQMPRLLGLAQASKVYKNNTLLHNHTQFSNKGNEVAFGTIGDASTSEGLFWETMNAAGVMQVPMVMSVWDDGHGISVAKKYQTTKESISTILKGFEKEKNTNGIKIFKTKGWDYKHLIDTYQEAVSTARENHIPVLVHVEEVTQPQGHSTSGSHERYKSQDRLQWEKDYDPIKKFKEYILDLGLATEDELNSLQKQAKKEVRAQQKEAWKEFDSENKILRDDAVNILEAIASESANSNFITPIITNLKAELEPLKHHSISAVRKVMRLTKSESLNNKNLAKDWLKTQEELNERRYSSLLYSDSDQSPLKIPQVEPTFSEEQVDARLVLRNNFEALFEKYPEVLTFGEDTGKIGGVNQSMEGMQEKFGETRVSDTGIREATILGQGIGLAMRGLRPIAEIQYLDYLYYALQIMRDDLASVHYRTFGRQKAPTIVRTRGHRLEGIWHSGSPMGAIINSIRGMIVAVPRNMVKAAGFYNLLLKGDDPALVIEPLNGYRRKEFLPTNLAEYTTPIGVPEITQEGSDLTIVSYGSTFNMCSTAAVELSQLGVSVELIDVQTLIPFDINHKIVESLKKTNRLMVVDEDIPGGASAFILNHILTDQKGYYHLDSEPVTLAAKEHLPAYSTDGDYFSKPSIDDIVERAYQIMNEANPSKYPSIY